MRFKCAVCGKPAATVVEPPVGPLEFRCADHADGNRRDTGKPMNASDLIHEMAYELIHCASYLESAISVLTGGDQAPWLPRSLGRVAGEAKAMAALATHYLDTAAQKEPGS